MAIRASDSLSPLLRWERVLEFASSNGFQHPTNTTHWFDESALAINEIEGYAKTAVKKVIDGCATTYPYRSARARYPFDEVFATVISLNFDHCWIGPYFSFDNTGQNKNGSELTHAEAGRLTNFIQPTRSKAPKVWFPNGSICDPSTIRMGLFDYGSQAHALKIAFSQVKAFERELVDSAETDQWDKYAPALEKELSKDQGLQDARLSNWVAQFLYRPIFFAGVGLSQTEIGLWWLLTQRARNLAKIPLKERPPTVILAHAQSHQRALWVNRPCGIEALYCEDWDHGWEMLLDRAKPGVFGGVF